MLQQSKLVTDGGIGDLMGAGGASTAGAGAIPEWAEGGSPPHIYDPMCSVYALDAGRRLIQRELLLQRATGTHMQRREQLHACE